MRKKLQELKTKLSGQEVFIVGGGYSVERINKNFLQDKLVIGINDSYQFLPNAVALYWCDNEWLRNHLDNLNSHPCKLRFNARHNGRAHVRQDIETTGGGTVLFRSGEMGFDPNPDNVKGNNGGAQCLNLIINMGAKRINLIGFDMRDDPLKPGRTNYHNNHHIQGRPDVYSRLFIPAMKELYKEVRRLRIDVDIVNCSPTSALQCFRKDRIKGLYND
jgi:hypothetical protein